MQQKVIHSKFRSIASLVVIPIIALLYLSCTQDPVSPDQTGGWSCRITDGSAPDFLTGIGCKDDFSALASDPLDASIPGAQSMKTVIDLKDPDKVDPLYFTNSNKYPIHWNFTSANLSGNGKPIVGGLSDFNVEYYSINRRFILGAITHYEGPKVWVYEIAPYDKANAEMIAKAYKIIADSCFFGD